MVMLQTRQAQKFCIHNKVVPLKSFLNSIKFKIKFMDFQCLNLKSNVFQEFQDLEKAVTSFKYFQALKGPVQIHKRA